MVAGSEQSPTRQHPILSRQLVTLLRGWRAKGPFSRQIAGSEATRENPLPNDTPVDERAVRRGLIEVVGRLQQALGRIPARDGLDPAGLDAAGAALATANAALCEATSWTGSARAS